MPSLLATGGEVEVTNDVTVGTLSEVTYIYPTYYNLYIEGSEESCHKPSNHKSFIAPSFKGFLIVVRKK